eukprot:TRINITY_DN101053_c0_g1_i1.p1 TRINITY_DN101053_c0_g1~~TRINITY_DN101053_c0_g1_i1.p1  ORF type:complete len:489 (-),score=104.45 TRINITY_DN101053_c0_g1_i1:101-1483(-)
MAPFSSVAAESFAAPAFVTAGSSAPASAVRHVATSLDFSSGRPAELGAVGSQASSASAVGAAAVIAGSVLAAAGARGSRRAGGTRKKLAKATTARGLGLAGPCGSFHAGAHLSAEQKAELEAVCKAICAAGKGITACDEGAGTIGMRLEPVGVENTEEARRVYRQMLFETPGVEEYLSAAILDPETMYQKDDKGVLFPEALKARGIVPGVKPHLKIYTLPGTDGETVMQGLDSLNVRCQEYKAAGAQFAKWRSPIVITANAPSDWVIEANMRDLARYALICQDEGLVPIVEPDVVMKGDHTLETAVAVNTKVQAALYRAMLDHGVYMEGSILKTNMVNPGLSCPQAYSVEEIAAANIATLRRVMPAAIPGVNFLSGGQSLENAAARLSAINKQKGNSPWNLSFSWSAALQFPLFELCRGKGGEMPISEMADLYLSELKIAGAASRGEYNPTAEAGGHVPP